MENKDHIFQAVLISNKKLVKTDPTSIPHKHIYIYIATHFPRLVQALQ